MRLAAVAIAVACLTTATAPLVVTAADPLPQDRGATGTWQKLLKLRTIASVMHTTAHPDDEHGGLLALLSRGEGARVSLLTLNRGEAGDNAIGPELFDRARPDPDRGAAPRRPVLRRRRAVLHDASSTTASRSGSRKRS